MDKKRFLTGATCAALILSNLMPVMAATQDFEPLADSSTGADIPVTCEISSGYTVTLPATITLSKVTGNTDYNYASDYKVGVKGNIDSAKSVFVVPTTEFTMSDTAKTRSAKGAITQDETKWTAKELDTGIDAVEKDALASIQIDLAGSYAGNVEYEFYLGNDTQASTGATVHLNGVSVQTTDGTKTTFTQDATLTSEEFQTLRDGDSVSMITSDGYMITLSNYSNINGLAQMQTFVKDADGVPEAVTVWVVIRH